MLDDFIAVVVRNNTAEAINMVDVTMIIRSADGVLIDAHQTRLLPLTVNPGEYGLFGFDVKYDPIELPDGFTVEFDIDAVSPSDFDMLNWFTDLEIESTTFQDGMIVGPVRNPSDEAAGPGTVARGFVVCLDTDGRLIRGTCCRRSWRYRPAGRPKSRWRRRPIAPSSSSRSASDPPAL